MWRLDSSSTRTAASLWLSSRPISESNSTRLVGLQLVQGDLTGSVEVGLAGDLDRGRLPASGGR